MTDKQQLKGMYVYLQYLRLHTPLKSIWQTDSKFDSNISGMFVDVLHGLAIPFKQLVTCP